MAGKATADEGRTSRFGARSDVGSHRLPQSLWSYCKFAGIRRCSGFDLRQILRWPRRCHQGTGLAADGSHLPGLIASCLTSTALGAVNGTCLIAGAEQWFGHLLIVVPQAQARWDGRRGIGPRFACARDLAGRVEGSRFAGWDLQRVMRPWPAWVETTARARHRCSRPSRLRN